MTKLSEAHEDRRPAAPDTIALATGAGFSPRKPGKGRNSLWRRVLRVRQARLGFIFLAFIVVVILFGRFFAPFAPSHIVGDPFLSPGDGTALGTDVLGRDILSRVLYGGFNLAWMAVCAAAIGIALGAAVGLSAAYFGKAVDAILMRAMDVLLSFPDIIFALLFVSMFGRSKWLLVVLVGISFMPGVSRVIRGAALPVLESEYVLWAKAVGVSPRHILTRDVLPNVTSPLMVESGMRLVWAIGSLASLSFIGYGIVPPAADWGLMVSENQDGLSTQPLTVIAPIVMIVIFALGGNLVAESISRVIARTEGEK